MKCTRCGRDLKNDKGNCTSCGAKINNSVNVKKSTKINGGVIIIMIFVVYAMSIFLYGSNKEYDNENILDLDPFYYGSWDCSYNDDDIKIDLGDRHLNIDYGDEQFLGKYKVVNIKNNEITVKHLITKDDGYYYKLYTLDLFEDDFKFINDNIVYNCKR